MNKYCSYLFMCLLFAMLYNTLFAQTNHYNQLWNRISIEETVKSAWSTQLDIGDNWTSTADNPHLFGYNAQVYFRGWAHYKINDRWKLSGFFAWYDNKTIPDIKQTHTQENRTAIQVVYTIKPQKYLLQTRFRFENRHIENAQGIFEGVYRFRTQMKLVYPFNKPAVGNNSIYGICTEELFFKTAGSSTGNELFDRNKFEIGLGYAFSNAVKAEITYVNEWLPRTTANNVYNALQCNVIFTNFFQQLLAGNKTHR